MVSQWFHAFQKPINQQIHGTQTNISPKGDWKTAEDGFLEQNPEPNQSDPNWPKDSGYFKIIWVWKRFRFCPVLRCTDLNLLKRSVGLIYSEGRGLSLGILHSHLDIGTRFGKYSQAWMDGHDMTYSSNFPNKASECVCCIWRFLNFYRRKMDDNLTCWGSKSWMVVSKAFC